MKKFSFVIPTYEKKESLYQVLDCLNNQTGYGPQDYEVIVVDDGSTCDTSSFIKGVNKNYNMKYIYIERTEDSCRPRTRNIGWRSTEGEIVIFIDDDILVPKHYLKEVDSYFQKRKELIVIGTRMDLGAVKDNNYAYDHVIDLAYKQNQINLLETRHASFTGLSYNLRAHRFPWFMTFSCNMAVSKSMLEKIDGFCEAFIHWGWEDLELGYRLQKENVPMVLNMKMEGLHIPHYISANNKEEKNFNIFIDKHPEALEGLSFRQIMNIYGLDIINYIGRNNKRVIDRYRVDRGLVDKTVEVDYKDSQDIEEVKEVIREATKESGVRIIVNDFVGDSSFHLWIQLLEHCNSIPLYYPRYLLSEEFTIQTMALDRLKRKVRI